MFKKKSNPPAEGSVCLCKVGNYSNTGFAIATFKNGKFVDADIPEAYEGLNDAVIEYTVLSANHDEKKIEIEITEEDFSISAVFGKIELFNKYKIDGCSSHCIESNYTDDEIPEILIDKMDETTSLCWDISNLLVNIDPDELEFMNEQKKGE